LGGTITKSGLGLVQPADTPLVPGKPLSSADCPSEAECLVLADERKWYFYFSHWTRPDIAPLMQKTPAAVTQEFVDLVAELEATAGHAHATDKLDKKSKLSIFTGVNAQECSSSASIALSHAYPTFLETAHLAFERGDSLEGVKFTKYKDFGDIDLITETNFVTRSQSISSDLLLLWHRKYGHRKYGHRNYWAKQAKMEDDRSYTSTATASTATSLAPGYGSRSDQTVPLHAHPGHLRPLRRRYAAHADCPDTLKSTTAYTFHLAGSLISWYTKSQH
jgi:hypothetical protein